MPVPDPVRIGILGDFNPEFRSHHATTESLQHCAKKLSVELESVWLPTPSLLAPDAPKVLETYDGLWASPGSPYKSFDGMSEDSVRARA
jgi:CTP synthase (UTP-ammonia lyase)